MTYGASGGFDQQVVWLQRNGKEIELAYCTKDIKAENPFKQYKVHRYWGN